MADPVGTIDDMKGGGWKTGLDEKAEAAGPAATPRPTSAPNWQQYLQLAQEARQAQQQYLQTHPFVSEQQPRWEFKPPEFDAMKAFGSAASVIGLLMGALTRGGITASLNASASAMTAIRQNDLMAYKEAKDTWEKNTELAIKNAKAHNEAVNRGLEIAKSDWGEYSAHMARVGALYGDLAKYEDPEAVEGRLIQRQTALLKFQQAQRDAQIESDNNLVDLNRAAEILGKKPEDLKTVDPARVAQARETARLERAAAENAAMHPESAANVLGKAHATAAGLRAQEQHREQWNTASSDQKAAWMAEADNELKAEQTARTAAARKSVDLSALGAEGKTDPDLQGEEVLKSLPTGIASQVRGIAEGREALPSIRSPKGAALAILVNQYDPTFDSTKAAARQALRKNVESGQIASNITSIQTVMGHLDELKKAWDKLGNGPNSVVNAIANRYESAIGSGNVTAVQVAAQAVADELTRTFRGAAGAQQEIKSWLSNISANAPPDAQKQALETMMNLISARMEPVQENWAEVMGPSTPPLQIIRTPRARQAYRDIMGEDPPGAPSSVTPAAKTPAGGASATAPKPAASLPQGWSVKVNP